MYFVDKGGGGSKSAKNVCMSFMDGPKPKISSSTFNSTIVRELADATNLRVKAIGFPLQTKCCPSNISSILL